MYKVVTSRLAETRRFIQVLSGPRQTGKTTLAQQAMDGIKISSHYTTADEPALKDRIWIEQQWEVARMKTKSGGRNNGSFPDIEAFSKEFKVKRKLLVGPQGISLDEFLLTPPEELFY